MVFNFPKLVKQLLTPFSSHNYSILNTRLFVSCWLGFSLDQNLQSMRDLFKRLHLGGIKIDISTFSKANQHRSFQPFEQLYQQGLGLVKQQRPSKQQSKSALDEYEICPIDSTVITLTGKLLWALGYHQVKLLNVFN